MFEFQIRHFKRSLEPGSQMTQFQLNPPPIVVAQLRTQRPRLNDFSIKIGHRLVPYYSKIIEPL